MAASGVKPALLFGGLVNCHQPSLHALNFSVCGRWECRYFGQAPDSSSLGDGSGWVEKRWRAGSDRLQWHWGGMVPESPCDGDWGLDGVAYINSLLDPVRGSLGVTEREFAATHHIIQPGGPTRGC
jgi:hypothetical protein